MSFEQPRWLPIAVVSVCILCGLTYQLGPFGTETQDSVRTISDTLYLGLVVLHVLLGAYVFYKRTLSTATWELLAGLTLILFLLSYLYALNANMDYVQRFAENSKNVRFAPDTSIERLNTLIRYVPLLLINILAILVSHKANNADILTRLALPMVLISVLLYTMAFPSFLSVAGMSPIAFVALVPVFFVLARNHGYQFVFYGTLFGVLQTMLINYWLATFSLVSLQLVTIVYLVFYIIFMLLLRALVRFLPKWGVLLFPFAWISFDFLRSTGFLGYPWGMIGTSQYAFVPFIQIASITGIWGVSFLVLLCNAGLVYLFSNFNIRNSQVSLAVILLLIGNNVLGGWIYLRTNIEPEGEPVKLALVQQNTDPRKNAYRDTLNILVHQTDQLLGDKPEIVFWSETAFVPNIRRWSQMDPERFANAATVRDFLQYQSSMGTWLLTGNDDYFLRPGEEGETERLDYNASILFDPQGNRVQTYHKMHLVPFTEYFPLKKVMPGIHRLLLTFDVFLWEPGKERTIFAHPSFAFFTPICFEDNFPNDVRLFVKQGVDAIVNISNDYWSLTEIEAKQHYANALFRAIENRRPLLRASASGITCHIDRNGKLLARLPAYETGGLITTLSVGARHTTFYNRLGDWFPFFSIAVCCATYVLVIAMAIRRKRK